MRAFISKAFKRARKAAHLPRAYAPQIVVLTGMGLGAFAVALWSLPAGLLVGAVCLVLVGIDLGRP